MAQRRQKHPKDVLQRGQKYYWQLDQGNHLECQIRQMPYLRTVAFAHDRIILHQHDFYQFRHIRILLCNFPQLCGFHLSEYLQPFPAVILSDSEWNMSARCPEYTSGYHPAPPPHNLSTAAAVSEISPRPSLSVCRYESVDFPYFADLPPP